MEVKFKCNSCKTDLADNSAIYLGEGHWICGICGSGAIKIIGNIFEAPSPNIKIIEKDSDVCDYCQRKQFPDTGDEIECSGCIFKGGCYNPNRLYFGYLSNNFFGAKCVATKE